MDRSGRAARRAARVLSLARVACALSLLLVVTSTLVAATWLVAPAPKAAAAPNPSTPSGKPGVAAATAQGLAKAKKAKKPVEVVAANTETTTVYANPDGTMTRVISQVPIRVRNAKGELVKVNTKLKRSGARLAPAASATAVSVSATGSDTLASLDPEGPGSLSMSFGDDLGKPKVTGDVATYPVVGDDSAQVTASTSVVGFSVRVNLSEAPDEVVSAGSPASASAGGAATQSPSAPATPGAAAVAGPEYRFPLSAKGLTPRLTAASTLTGPAQRLEFVSPEGAVVAASSPLTMWDSNRDASGEPTRRVAVDASLETEGGSSTLVLRPSAAWLADPATTYPVVVDPDVYVGRYGDTSVASTAPNSPSAGDYALYTGKAGTAASNPNWRAFSMFTLDQYVGKVVTEAKLNLFQIGTAACTGSKGTRVAPSAPKNTEDVTYGLSTKTDARWISATSYVLNGNSGPCGSNTSAVVPQGPVSFDVTKALSGYATGVVDSDTKAAGVTTVNGQQNLALLRISALDESDGAVSTMKTFCSLNAAPSTSACATAGRSPTLSLTYIPDLGVSKSYALDKHSLDAKSQLAINQDGGNAVVQSRDFSIKGVGLDLTMDRYYNSGYPSDTEATSSLGTTGWNFSVGSDIRLDAQSYDGMRLVYHAADGHTYGPFVRKSYTASSDPGNDYNKFESIKYGGVGAELVSNGASGAAEVLTLTMRSSQTKYSFTKVDPNSSSYYLVKVADRNDNTVKVGYVSGGHRVSVIKQTDATTTGRLVSFAYNSNDDVTSITDSNGPSTRVWSYGYDGRQLTSYTDPTGAVTTYGYTSYNLGSVSRTLLTSVVNPQVTNPHTNAQQTPETRIEYISGQATRVKYRTGPGDNDFASFTFNYYSAYGGGCPVRADRYTIRVDNKNAGQTTYCFADRGSDAGSGGDGSAATYVSDNYGNKQSTTYNPDGNATTGISPSNQGSSTNGATKVSYGSEASGLLDQVDTVTSPTNGSDSSKASNEVYKYKADSAIAGYKYLPTSKRDANAVCTAFTYWKKNETGGAEGQIRAAYLDVAENAAKDCSTKTRSNNAWYATYFPNGTLASSWDSNAPGASPTTTPAQGDRTQYSYYAANDVGSGGPNGAGLLKAVVKPGGVCSDTTTRKLCTTYTYDGLGRVVTVTDGRGKLTSYSYDKNDRTTQVLFDGATSCTASAVSTGTCIKYTYDDEGNLTKREEAAGTTTISWTWLNQQAKQITPDGSSSTNTWDASGNLLQYDQSVKVGSQTYNDTVAYTYDDANRVIAVTDNPGTSNARVIKTDRDSESRLFRARFIAPQVSNSFGYTNTGAAATASAEPTSGGVNRQFLNFKYGYNDEDDKDNKDAETTHLQNVQSAGSTGVAATNWDYDYTANRLVTVKRHGTDDKQLEYMFDEAGNVKQKKVNDTSSTYYGVDGTGNLCWTTTSEPSTTHATSCPALPSTGSTVAYGQDGAGNNTGTSAQPLTYNPIGQAASIGGEAKNYLDQGNNLLTGSGTGSTAKTYFFGTLGLTAAADSSGEPTFYTRDADGRILNSHGPAVGGSNSSNAASYVYYLLDGQKSVAGLVDDSGTYLGSYTYDPYGAATSIKNGSGSDAATGDAVTRNPFRYRSGFRDTTGLYHFGARFYDATILRWTQPDPESGSIADPSTLGSYAYSACNPTSLTDLTGRAVSRCYSAFLYFNFLLAGLGYAVYKGALKDPISATFLITGAAVGLANQGTNVEEACPPVSYDVYGSPAKPNGPSYRPGEY